MNKTNAKMAARTPIIWISFGRSLKAIIPIMKLSITMEMLIIPNTLLALKYEGFNAANKKYILKKLGKPKMNPASILLALNFFFFLIINVPNVVIPIIPALKNEMEVKIELFPSFMTVLLQIERMISMSPEPKNIASNIPDSFSLAPFLGKEIKMMLSPAKIIPNTLSTVKPSL